MAINKNHIQGNGVQTDGNFIVMLVPADEVTDFTNISATLLNGPTAIDVTYELVSDGWNHTPGNQETTSTRLTSPIEHVRDGKQTDTLEITYVYDPEDESPDRLDNALVTGAKYVFVTRPAVSHEQDFAAADKVRVFPVVCQRKRDSAPTAGADFTKVAQLRPFSAVLDDVALVAGA